MRFFQLVAFACRAGERWFKSRFGFHWHVEMVSVAHNEPPKTFNSGPARCLPSNREEIGGPYNTRLTVKGCRNCGLGAFARPEAP